MPLLAAGDLNWVNFVMTLALNIQFTFAPFSLCHDTAYPD
jgi:hypothetical protein